MNESNMAKADNLSVEQLDAIYTQCLDIVSEVCAIARSDLRMVQTTHHAGASDEKPVVANCLMDAAPGLVLELINAAFRIAFYANRLIDGHDDISRQANASNYSPEATTANGPQSHSGPI